MGDSDKREATLSTRLVWETLRLSASQPLKPAAQQKLALAISLVQPDIEFYPAQLHRAFNAAVRLPVLQQWPQFKRIETEDEALEKLGSAIRLSVDPMRGAAWDADDFGI